MFGFIKDVLTFALMITVIAYLLGFVLRPASEEFAVPTAKYHNQALAYAGDKPENFFDFMKNPQDAVLVNTSGSEIHIDFKESIVGIAEYKKVIKIIQEAPKEKTIVLHLANFGGLVHTGAALFNALESTKATIKAIIDAPSFSMGAMLACTASEVNIRPYSFLMYHDYSMGAQGKGSEIRGYTQATDKLANKMLQKCVKLGILTNEQIKLIQGGNDVYIHPEDLHTKEVVK